MRFAFFSMTIWLALAGLAAAQEAPLAPPQKPGDEIGSFVSIILGSLGKEWTDVFQKDGQTYREPVLVLYHDQTRAECGGVVHGSFYCPSDDKIYLDTSFFREIGTKLQGCDDGNAACRFSQAYVIAHQVSHHVQNLLGILPKIEQQRQRMDHAAFARLQVRAELQADCLAGMWAGKAFLVETGDVEAALRATSAVGEDMVRRKEAGQAVLDSFTHGSPEQRQRWFLAGYKGGTVAGCNTFRSMD